MPDEIADLMDFSTVVEFLESLHTTTLSRRIFGWKKICNEAKAAVEALGMIGDEYREKVVAYRGTVQRTEKDLARSYAQYAALRDDKQELTNNLSTIKELELEILAELKRSR